MFLKPLACCLVIFVTAGGCTSAARNAAGVLAANTSRANAEIEKMTASRRQIEAARSRLIDSMERSTLEAGSSTSRRIDVWRALAETDASSKARVQLFDAAHRHVEAEVARQAEIDKLDEKLEAAAAVARGSRAAELTQAASHLAALAKALSLKQELAFLFDYAKSVQKSLAAATEDAKKAEARATNVAASASRP